ncbi:MAG TPA: hypothetical protein VGI67_09730 [Thermoleophilaceae bacterium]
MDLRRLRGADWAAGLFGAVLIGLLWAPWFKAPGSFTAWQSMAVDDVFLFIAGALGVWVLVSTTAYSTGAVPIAAAAFANFASFLASILAAVRLIWPPDLGPGPTGRAYGVWLGTAAATLLLVSAIAAMRGERRTAADPTQVPITELPAPRAGQEGSGA